MIYGSPPMKWTSPSKLRCEIWMPWSDFVKLHYAALLKNTVYARQTAQMKAWSPGVCIFGFPRTGWDSRRLGGRFSRRDLTFWGDTRAVPLRIIVWALHNASSHVQSSASLMVAVWPTYWRFRRCFARCSRRPHHMHFCVSVAQFMVSETRVSNHCFGSVLSV